jgi:hypothetical protein
MSTNLTTVTVTQVGTYALPISYSNITLLTSIDKSEQLIVQRTSIADIMSLDLDSAEYVSFGRIPSAWMTFDDTHRTITSIYIPPGSVATFTDGTTAAIPALEANEPLQIQRRTMYAEPYIEWVSGTRITSDQLNANTEQLLGIIQELREQIDYLMSRDVTSVHNPVTENLDMAGFQILGLPNMATGQNPVTKTDLETFVTDLYGVPNGLATLDGSGTVPTSQIPGAVGTLPSTFFAQNTKPVRSTSGSGLFDWGSLWWNATNGRLYIYIQDDRYAGLLLSYNGEVGYWVDISSNI